MKNLIYRYQIQKNIFKEKLSSTDLLNISLKNSSNPISKNINVWMNHNFETILTYMKPYFTYQDMDIKIRVSNYDYSLMFQDHIDASLEIIFLDLEKFKDRLNSYEILTWLNQRIIHLRNISSGTILLLTWDENITTDIENFINNIPQCYYVDLLKLSKNKNIKFLDMRLKEITGTKLSKHLQIILAREIACKFVPAFFFSSVKAICLDLDNTLHCGVLGEDGIDGVIVTPQHKILQAYLKKLKDSGIFLALVSKNNEEDVKNLFKSRNDYVLSLNDFSALEISWDDKSDSITKIANKLKIGIDSILFVDDNIGELLSVIEAHRNIRAVLACEDATVTKDIIENYPGIFRWSVTQEDKKRIEDLRNNDLREHLSNAEQSDEEYFKNLEVSLVYSINCRDHLNRITDLCNKTNQFNLCLNRFNQTDVSQRLENDRSSIITVELSDRLSDSGIIGVIIADLENKKLVIKELCISCRAMGRRLENIIISRAIRLMPIFEKCETVHFDVKIGPRNLPALKWINQLTNEVIDTNNLVTIDKNVFEMFNPVDGVKMRIKNG